MSNATAAHRRRTWYAQARANIEGDFIAQRAAFMAWRNANEADFLATLAVGSRYRNVALYRAQTGRKLLGM